MYEFSDVQLSQMLGQYLWPLVRISAFLLAVPIFGARSVPARIRIALAFPLCILVTPLLPALPDVELLSLAGLVTTIQQVVIGLAMGFVVQIFMQLFIVGGQVIAMNMGLGFASMNDPANGVSVTVLSQFYLTLATLLFLCINGHLVLIELIVVSFQAWPIGEFGLDAEFWYEIAALGGWMFAGGLVLSLPVVTAVLVVNTTFGVMSRSAPQMNVFSVGFPVTLVFGMLIFWFGLVNFLPQFQLRTEQILLFLKTALGV